MVSFLRISILRQTAGLYAEMIENRSFEAKEGFGTPGNFYAVDDCGYGMDSGQCKDGGAAEPRLQFVTGLPRFLW